jgi:[ribosomal protein S18]-alanine N-acetyltransferase
MGVTTSEALRVERLGDDPVDAEACRRLNASLAGPGGFDPGEEAGRAHGRVWVARAAADASGIRGFLVAWRVADELEILFVATDPAYRRRGVGRALVGRALEEASEEGLKKVLLEVAGRNEAARGLYEAMGFREEGVRRGYYADGDDAVLMGRGAGPGRDGG